VKVKTIKEYDKRLCLSTLFDDIHPGPSSSLQGKKSLVVKGSTEIGHTQQLSEISPTLTVGDMANIGIKSIVFECPIVQCNMQTATAMVKGACSAFEKLMSVSRVFPKEKVSRYFCTMFTLKNIKDFVILLMIHG